ncbi:cytochrome P450 [Annulohypoxylon maeteangense]|uniref:cytochrome P450 n=1 Tax=Annulohypoxylon maeteangense TaxID=1927788 RepID=UPI0020073543|nr:cytochrome P450 [Annulohypoxylon maeteangense]KAI0888201.1 cytochrome P450 [Annulohypoxylon maeteangense]
MAILTISDVYTPTIITIIAGFIYKYIFYPSIISPLSKIPKAHWSCSISPAWILWARFQSRENRTLHAAHQHHGPIVRVGPNELSVNSIEGVKTIYQGGFDKHEWYSVFNNYGVPCAFSALTSKSHSQRKRMVSHVYSKTSIHSSPALRSQAHTILSTRLLPLLLSSTHTSQAPHGIDVHSLFCATAMDFITAYCFGLPRCADFVRRRAYREHWLALYTVRTGYGFFAQELPLLSSVFSCLGIKLTPTWASNATRELEAWCKELSDATVRFLDREKEELGKGEGGSVVGTADDPVVVRALLAGIEKEYSAHGAESLLYSTVIQQRELSVASEIFDHVLAGQETTGVALTYLSYHLSQSLDLQRELRQELLTLEPSMRYVSEDRDKEKGNKIKMPDSRQLDNLPILHAMVMETVRRYVPAGGPEPRVTPSSSSCRIGPYEVPCGVRVSASAYNLHRDETVFPDAERWDHTRWLRNEVTTELDDSNGGKEKSNLNRHFWGFSSGGRMCLGSNFAMHDMKLIIAAIYSNYTTYVVDDEGIEPTDAYTGHPKGNSLYLRFERVTMG